MRKQVDAHISINKKVACIMWVVQSKFNNKTEGNYHLGLIGEFFCWGGSIWLGSELLDKLLQ